MYIKIEVCPDSKREVLEKKSQDSFLVKVKEPAERNMANKRVLELIARHFEVPLNCAKMISGHRSRKKIISVYKK